MLLSSDQDEDEELPFEVEVERPPVAASVVTVLLLGVCIAVALRVLPPFALVPLLAALAIARRFSSSSARAIVDRDGLWIDEDLVVARADRLDAVAVADDVDTRAIVAGKDASYVMHLPNAAQSRRLVEALGEGDWVAVGSVPRAVDLLGALRFLGVAIAVGVDTWRMAVPIVAYSVVLVVIFVASRRVAAGPEGIEVRRFGSARFVSYADIDALDGETLRLKNGSWISIARRWVRDPTLARPKWLGGLYSSVLERITEGLKSERGARPTASRPAS